MPHRAIKYDSLNRQPGFPLLSFLQKKTLQKRISVAIPSRNFAAIDSFQLKRTLREGLKQAAVQRGKPDSSTAFCYWHAPN
jgi:hypothetical protein